MDQNNLKVDKCAAKQHFISQQVQANGQAVYRCICSRVEIQHLSILTSKIQFLTTHRQKCTFLPLMALIQIKVWLDKCRNYFSIYNVPDTVWVTAATMHLEGNTARWYQAYKRSHTKVSWIPFCVAVEQKFGQDDYRSDITDLLALRQTGTVKGMYIFISVTPI